MTFLYKALIHKSVCFLNIWISFRDLTARIENT